jgi:hypothetical protein
MELIVRRQSHQPFCDEASRVPSLCCPFPELDSRSESSKEENILQKETFPLTQ